MKETTKKSGRYIMYCTNPECKHEWFTKHFEYVCPKCKSVILDYEVV